MNDESKTRNSNSFQSVFFSSSTSRYPLKEDAQGTNAEFRSPSKRNTPKSRASLSIVEQQSPFSKSQGHYQEEKEKMELTSTFGKPKRNGDQEMINIPMGLDKVIFNKKTNLDFEMDSKSSQFVSSSSSDRQQRFSGQTHQGNQYLKMKSERDRLREMYVRQGKMADPNAKYKLGEAPKFVAECMDMCPEFERQEREFQTGGLDKFEKIPGTDLVDPNRAVKRYRRSAAGDPPPLPCDVRPPNVLQKTFDYLMNDILDIYGLVDSYSFIRDRARAIRNDLTLQNYRGPEAIDLHERIARYHILCSHDLCDAQGVSLQQEHEQLRKTLQSLMEYYSERRVDSKSASPNEAEFQAYYILTHAYSNDVVSKAESLPSEVFFHPMVQKAISIQSMMARTNEDYIQDRASESGSLNFYSGLFRELSKPTIPYLFACCVHMSFIDIRRGALKAMQKSYYCFPNDDRTTWPIQDLIDLLGFDDITDALQSLNYYEIPNQVDRVPPIALIGKIGSVINHKLQMEKGGFVEGQRKSLDPVPSKAIVDAKKGQYSDVDLVQGRASYDFTKMVEPPIRPNFAIRPTNFKKIDMVKNHGVPLVPQIDLETTSSEITKNLNQENSIASPFSLIKENSRKPETSCKPHKEKKMQQNISDNFLAEYVISLIDEQIKMVLSTGAFVKSAMKERKTMQHTIYDDFVEDLLEDFTKAQLVSFFETAKKVNIFRNALMDITTSFFDEHISKELQVISLDEFKKIASYERFGWDRWRFMIHFKKHLAGQRKKKTLSFLLNLKGYGSGSLLSKAPPILEYSEGYLNALNHFEKDLYKDSNRKRLDIANILLNAKSKILTWKLVLSVPTQIPSLTSAGSKLYAWLLSIFSSTNIPMKMLTDEPHSKILGFFQSSTKYEKTYSALVQQLLTPKIQKDLQSNDASISSGANAALFALEFFDQSSDYWNNQSFRLFAFLSTFPKQAKLPLIIICFSDPVLHLSSKYILETLSLGDIMKSGLISNVKVEFLYIQHLSFDPLQAHLQLTEAISWLIKFTEPLPKLSRKIVEAVKSCGLILFYNECISGIQESFSQPWFLGVPLIHHARIFNECIYIFNDMIEVLAQILTSENLEELAYPAKEFVDLKLLEDIDINWNSQKKLQRIRTEVLAFCLPYLSQPSIFESRSLESMYQNYVQSLSLPGLEEYKKQELVDQIGGILSDPNLTAFYLIKIVKACSHASFSLLERNLLESEFPFLQSDLSSAIKEFKRNASEKIKKLKSLLDIEIQHPINVVDDELYEPRRKRFKDNQNHKISEARKKMRSILTSAKDDLEHLV